MNNQLASAIIREFPRFVLVMLTTVAAVMLIHEAFTRPVVHYVVPLPSGPMVTPESIDIDQPRELFL